jgi:hypothetical protein
LTSAAILVPTDFLDSPVPSEISRVVLNSLPALRRILRKATMA